jgi:hypothetical protein
MDIYEVKQLVDKKMPYFFSTATLKGFGQTMASFKVKTSPSGRVFIFAPCKVDRKTVHYTFREVVDGDLKLVRAADTGYALAAHETLKDINQYIKAH